MSATSETHVADGVEGVRGRRHAPGPRAPDFVSLTFLRLLRWYEPLLWLALVWVVSYFALAVAWAILGGRDPWLQVPATVQASAVGMALLIVPSLLVGLLVGHRLRELEHCFFAWSLPRLRRKLWFPILAIGVVVVTGDVFWTMSNATRVWPATTELRSIFMWLALPSLPVAAVAFAAYAAGIAGTRFALGGMILAALGLHALASLSSELPWLSSALLLLAGFAVIRLALSDSQARSRPFVPTLPSGLGGRTRYERQVRGRWRGRGMRWPHRHVRGPREWLHAVFYENHGFRPWALVALVCALSVAGIVGIGLMVASSGLKTMAEAQWSLSWWWWRGPIRLPPRSFLAHGVAIFFALLTMPAAAALNPFRVSFPRARLLYPLSRAQRARLAYRSSLVENVAFCGLLAGFLVVLVRYGIVFRGYEAIWSAGVLRALAVVFVLLPVLQWFRLRYLATDAHRRSGARLWTYLGLMLVLTYVAGWTLMVWTTLVPGLWLTADFLLALLLGLLSQRLYRSAIRLHYATADLE